MIFSGANTYGGQTSVEEGALVVDNAHALGLNANGTTVVDGAVLELRSNLDAEPVTLNGHGCRSTATTPAACATSPATTPTPAR